MPKVIQVNTVSNYGSTGKIMEAIGVLAKAGGWDSKIAVGARYSQPSVLDTFQISSKWQSYISALYTLITDRHGFSNRIETRHFVSWLQKESPDIIHLHNIHSYILNIELLFKYLLKSNIPVIWTLHDCWPFTGHCSHFIGAHCYKWKTGCYQCPQTRAFPRSLLIDNSQKNYSDKKRLFCSLRKLHIVTVSEWLGDCVKSSFLGKYNVTVIPNGVNLDLFRPKPSDLKAKYGLEGKTVLLGVSTDWCKAKGLADYIELRKHLTEEFAIVLVGMTPRQINELSATGLVCIEKTRCVDELVEWYNAANIILNISYAETFGLPVAEGYACGKPAVVYDNTALSELIGVNTGLKVPTGEIGELVEAVNVIAKTNPDRFLDSCRTRAEEMYDREKNYKRYVDLYCKAITSWPYE